MKINPTLKKMVLIAAVVLICLGHVSQSQAWWLSAGGFPYETSGGDTWWCYPYSPWCYSVGNGAVWYCYCVDQWGSGYGEYTPVGYHWFFYDYQSHELHLLSRGGW